ncbi:unnamed protein product [Tenebrio molitor]|nr:unnamed protein product [Tenebrio molitor]
MSVATFHELLLKVAPIIKKQDTVLTRNSSCETKVTISLEIPCHWRELYKSTVRFSDICS